MHVSPPLDDLLLWQFDIGDSESVLVFSSVVDGVVYAGSYDNEVYALDALSGELLWSFESATYLRPPPQVADGVMLTGGELFDAPHRGTSLERRGLCSPREWRKGIRLRFLRCRRVRRGIRGAVVAH